MEQTSRNETNSTKYDNHGNEMSVNSMENGELNGEWAGSSKSISRAGQGQRAPVEDTSLLLYFCLGPTPGVAEGWAELARWLQVLLPVIPCPVYLGVPHLPRPLVGSHLAVTE